MAPAPTEGMIVYGNETRVVDEWGTSSSCAVVAGLAALIVSLRPDLSSIAVMEIIRSTARPKGQPRACEGSGLIDCYEALNIASKITS